MIQISLTYSQSFQLINRNRMIGLYQAVFDFVASYFVIIFSFSVLLLVV